MTCCRSNERNILTFTMYERRTYQCFEFDKRPIISIDDVHMCLKEAEIPLSSDDIIEIENDQKEHIVVNNHLLANENPWKLHSNEHQSLSSNRVVKLRVV